MSLPSPAASQTGHCSEEKPYDRVVRTWKRIKRSKEGEDDQRSTPSLKRPCVADECLDFLRKKRVVSQDDQVWLEDEGCYDIVHSAWRNNYGTSPMENIVGKIHKFRLVSSGGVRSHLGTSHNITRQLKEKKTLLKHAETVAVQRGNMELVQQLKHEIQGLLLVEGKLWQQRSKSHWIKSGYKNTSFFHNRASHRFRHNTIHGLRNSRGEMCNGDDKVADLMVEHYIGLFTSLQPSEIDSVSQHVSRC
nr:hypothetical protein CFP56_70869 [Quercus suber]